MTDARLQPTTRNVYIVRYIGSGRGDVKHRYYSRRHDAEAYAAKLRGYGKHPQVFATRTEWVAT